MSNLPMGARYDPNAPFNEIPEYEYIELEIVLNLVTKIEKGTSKERIDQEKQTILDNLGSNYEIIEIYEL